MARWLTIVLLIGTGMVAEAAVRSFDFNQYATDAYPTGCISLVTGKGEPGDWKIIEKEVPSAFAPLSPGGKSQSRQNVLAQLSRGPQDERFPLLILSGDSYWDFTFMAKVQCVDGKVEQMAGLAFRIQDENNYYVVRASALGNSFRFYKFVNGVRSAPIGPTIPVPRGEWLNIAVECTANQIRCLLNGKDAIPAMKDNSFLSGKVGFWTKSDSVSYFANPQIIYTPRILLAQSLAEKAVEKRPSVTDVRFYMKDSATGQIKAVASASPEGKGEAGGEVEQNVLANNTMYHGQTKRFTTVTLPLHDRNGEVVAAVRVVMKSFLGQTQSTSLFRGMEIVKDIEKRFSDAKELIQ